MKMDANELKMNKRVENFQFFANDMLTGAKAEERIELEVTSTK
jgi:hypothetical protein